MVQDIPYRATSGYKRYRTWQSVQKVGDVRWVMEDDVIVNPDGSTQIYIAKRLHPQMDRGAAVPAQAARPAALGGAAEPLSSQDRRRALFRP